MKYAIYVLNSIELNIIVNVVICHCLDFNIHKMYLLYAVFAIWTYTIQYLYNQHIQGVNKYATMQQS